MARRARVSNGLSVTLVDYQRPPFDPTVEGPDVDVDAPAGDRQEGGLGIHLVKQMVDSIDYRYEDADGRATITFTKQPE